MQGLKLAKYLRTQQVACYHLQVGDLLWYSSFSVVYSPEDIVLVEAIVDPGKQYAQPMKVSLNNGDKSFIHLFDADKLHHLVTIVARDCLR